MTVSLVADDCLSFVNSDGDRSSLVDGPLRDVVAMPAIMDEGTGELERPVVFADEALAATEEEDVDEMV